MDRRRFLPTYHYEDNTDGLLLNSVGKPLRDYKVYGASGGVGSMGKNLFDKDNVNYIIGYFNRNSTAISSHANARTIYIPCEPNTTYTISRDTTYTNFHLGYTTELPATGTATYGGVTADNTTITHLTTTTGADAKYLIAYLYNGYAAESAEGGWESIINGLQIEKGDTATEYEPYECKIAIKVTGENLFDKAAPFDVIRKSFAPAVSTEGNTTAIASDNTTVTNYGAWVIPTNGRSDFVLSAKALKVTNHAWLGIRKADEIPDYIDTANVFGDNLLQLTNIENTDYEYAFTADAEYVVLMAITNGGSIEFRDLQLRTDLGAFEIPLPSLLGVGDYIDFMNKKIAADGEEQDAELPVIPTSKGTVNISVIGDVQPSRVLWQYYRKGGGI